jgi:hypothetical protein
MTNRLLTEEEATQICDLWQIAINEATTSPRYWSWHGLIEMAEIEIVERAHEATLKEVGKWLDNWWEEGKGGQHNWYKLEAFIQALRQGKWLEGEGT